MTGDVADGHDLRRQSLALEISNGLVQLMSRYTGRGPTRARTTVDKDFVLAVFHETLTKAEQNLVAAGNARAVHFMRENFEELMHGEAVDLVERLTGRRVLSLLSDVDPQANVAVQVFLLERAREDAGADEG